MSSCAPGESLTVGEMIRRTGVAASALQFTEGLGLITPDRMAGDQRRYVREMRRPISLITVPRGLGTPRSDAQPTFADVPLSETPCHADLQQVSRRWKRELEKRREGIERLEREPTGRIGCGCLAMKACGLLNPDEALGTQGAGPRRLGA